MVIPNSSVNPSPTNPTPAGGGSQSSEKPPVQGGGDSGSGSGNDGGDGTGGTDTGISTANGYLNVELPKDAKVYVNGVLTKTPGANRQYVSRDLIAGETYPYEVRAEVTRDGKKLTQTRLVNLYAGSNKSIAFDFDAEASPITSVTLNVPSDAKVVLGGVVTTTSGPLRYYSTKELGKGEVWKDYKVEVSVNRNGKTEKQVKTVSIEAGQSVQLSFDFSKPAAEKVAAKRP